MAAGSSSNPPAELDEALRVDVRVLGDLLGEVLRQQAAPDVYATVERIREQGKALREPDASDRDPALAELYAIVEALPPEKVGEVCLLYNI